MATICKRDLLKKAWLDLAEEGWVLKFKDVEKVWDHALAIFSQRLQEGHTVKLGNLGSLKLKSISARLAHVPSTGKRMIVPEHKAVSWTTNRRFKREINAEQEPEA